MINLYFDFHPKPYHTAFIGKKPLSKVDVGRCVDEAIDMFSFLPFKVVNDCCGLSVFADSLF